MNTWIMTLRQAAWLPLGPTRMELATWRLGKKNPTSYRCLNPQLWARYDRGVSESTRVRRCHKVTGLAKPGVLSGREPTQASGSSRSA